MMKHVNFVAGERDLRNLEVIREFYGLDTNAAAIRFALQYIARRIEASTAEK